MGELPHKLSLISGVAYHSQPPEGVPGLAEGQVLSDKSAISVANYVLLSNQRASHVESALVCIGGNDRHKLRYQRTVDFDLHVPKVCVVIDASECLFWSSGENFDEPFEVPKAVNESGWNDARANLRSTVFAGAASSVHRWCCRGCGCVGKVV
jgi:hypothetical protein